MCKLKNITLVLWENVQLRINCTTEVLLYPLSCRTDSGIYYIILQVLISFLEYLEKWKQEHYDPKHFISESTYLGLKTTLKSTLEIKDYLTTELNYEYLMTSRTNSDALEVS